MARIRTIKPEFFLHEGLAELSPLHRLLFIGLWTLADKRGVLEDRPRKIKAALFPWESACDVDAMLWDLAEAGLIRRFVGPNKRGEETETIAIPAFERHQRPHPKELQSDLPDLKTASREKKRPAITNPPSIPSSPAGKEILDSGKELWEGKGTEKPPDNPVAAMGALSVPAITQAAQPDRRAEPRPPVNPNDTLRDAVERMWEHQRGSKPRGISDADLRAAYDKAGCEPRELLRVLASGLKRAHFPVLTKFPDLIQHWDAYAATKGPDGGRKTSPHGRATDADKFTPDYEPPTDENGEVDLGKVVGL